MLFYWLFVQCALSTRDSAKMFEFKDTPDSIVISGTKGTANIVCENGSWFVGDKKYPANESSIDSIIETISSIRALDKVGTVNSDAAVERYELNEGKKLTVTASKDGKVLRSIEIGKDATASSQGYITVDGGKDIYLASGNLKILLDKSVDELRSRVVWSFEKADINSVTIEPVDGAAWSVSKMGTGDDVVWNASGVTIDVDAAKATEWFNGLATISTPVWYGEGEELGGNKIVSAKIGVGFNTASIDIYEIPAVGEDGKAKYWATCSETPYTFELANYAVQKFQKNADELSK